jgi:hypothetical protein
MRVVIIMEVRFKVIRVTESLLSNTGIFASRQTMFAHAATPQACCRRLAGSFPEFPGATTAGETPAARF